MINTQNDDKFRASRIILKSDEKDKNWCWMLEKSKKHEKYWRGRKMVNKSKNIESMYCEKVEKCQENVKK